MIRIVFFILLIFIETSLNAQVNLKQGLVAYYPFSGNANDASGNNINGIVNGAVLTTDATGNANSAYEFNGTSSYISLSFNSLYDFLPSDSFSIAAWMQPYSNTIYAASALVVKSPFNSNYLASMWNYGLYTVNNKAMSGWAANNIINGTTTMQPSQCWYHLALTYKNGIWHLYVNSQQEAQDLTQTHFIIQDGANSSIAFGRKGQASGDYYKGKMDEVRIYNRNLNPAEVKALYDIYNTKPDFSFTQNVCTPNQITFKNETSNTSSFLWNFGNNSTNNTNPNPVVNYATYNNYNVKLVVNQTNGCIDSVEKNIAVNVSLDTTLIINKDTSICLGATFKINVKDTGLAYCWYASSGSVISNAINQTVTPTTNTVYYFNSKVAGNNLVINGDFEAGNTGFTSEYSYKTPPRTSQSQYYIGTNPNAWFNPFVACKDHTSNSGNMMMFDGSATANTAMWKQTIAVKPNTDYLFSGWVQSIVAQDPAQIILKINGNKVGSTTKADLNACSWKQFSAIWNSGSNTSANLSILDSNIVVQGNDFAIDDISFAPLIIKTDSLKVVVSNCNTNPSCKGVVELHGNDRINLPASYARYYAATGFTWETWFNSNYYDNNSNSIGPRNKLMCALDLIPAEDILIGFGWSVGAKKSELCFVVDGKEPNPLSIANRDNTPCVYKPAGGFVPNTWYHVAGVRDYANNQTKLYVNGQLVDTKTNNRSPITREMTAFLGNFSQLLDSGFAGKMDEIRIWNTVRTATEIQTNYNKCLSGTETGLVAYYRSNEAKDKTLNDASKNGNNATLSSTANFNKTDNAPIINVCLQATESFDTATICNGQIYWGHTTTNTFIDTLVNTFGCDSLRHLKLTVLTTATNTFKDTINACGSYLFNGINYTSNAILNNTIKNHLGCDSILKQTQLFISKNIIKTTNDTICKGQSLLGHSTTGLYQIDSTRLISGCDSFNMLNLIVDSFVRISIYPVICFDSSYKKHNITGVYFDTIRATSFCDSIQTIYLTVNKKPNPTLPSDTSICSGDILKLYPGKFADYLWSNNKKTTSINVQDTGKYWVLVTDSIGCKNSDTMHLIALYLKPKDFLPNPHNACNGEKFTLPNYISYQWITAEATATIQLNGLPNYWVKVTDKNYCEGSDTMKIIYTGFDRFAATNVFTPNNDNRNDFFKPIDASCITAFEMKIYNRWGQLVYQTRNAQGNGWNGNDMSGNPTPIGVYYFIVSYKNVNDITLKQSGSITLLR